MTPDYRIVANDEDITQLLRDRLISIRTTDKPGIEADMCEIHIDDRDDKVALPKRGATLEISLGYKEDDKLSFIGKYQVDEIEISGPPQVMVIRGKPANLATSLKKQKRWSWENTTLAAIVGDIARRNKLQPLCRVETPIPRADQINESDMHFITRLAKQHGVTATVKDGKLIVARRGEGKTGSGKPLPEITLTRDDLASYTLTFPDRALFKEVQANWLDGRTGTLQNVVLSTPNTPTGVAAPRYTERHTYPNEQAATAAAKAKADFLNRQTMTGRAELMKGRADVGAEKWVTLTGIKSDADGTYLIESVEQNYTKSAWVTSINLSAGNGGKGKVGRDKGGSANDTILLGKPPT